jgi:hypothetical protein
MFSALISLQTNRLCLLVPPFTNVNVYFSLLSRGVDDFSEEDAKFFGPLFVVEDCFGYLRMFCHFFLRSTINSLPL